MDFSGIQIVSACMSVSPNIKAYFEEERYLAELDQPELLTPNLVCVMATNLLLDELAEIGIETNQDAEAICEYPTEFNTVLDMRTAFDQDQLYALLKRMTNTQLAGFQATVDECQHPGDLLLELSEYCAIHFPTDERWQNIMTSATHWWWSTDRLLAHVNAILKHVTEDSDPNPSVVDDQNLKVITAFLQHHAQRKADLKKFVDYVVDVNRDKVDTVQLYRLLEHYDRDMLVPDLLPKFADYEAHPQLYRTHGGKLSASFVIDHCLRSSNCIDHWLQADALPTTSQLTLLVGSYYAHGHLKQQLIKELNPLIERYHDYPELIKWLSWLVNLDYSAIVAGEMNHAAVTE